MFTTMHQIPSLDKSFQIGREGSWSENVMRRRHAVARSDSDSVSPSPPPESLAPKSPALPPALKKSSSCTCRKSNSSSKKRNESKILIHVKSSDKVNRDMSLYQMEAKLYNAELEEAMSSERLERSHRQLHSVAQLLDVQVMYMQSLHLKARAADRLVHLAGTFSFKDISPSESLSQKRASISWNGGVLERLADVQTLASDYKETPEQLYQLLEEFRDKRKDFKTASSTFSQYLNTTSRVSTSLMRKYEGQYDAIRGAYDLSRQALEAEFPKLIHERQKVLEHCFSTFIPVQHDLIEQDTQVLALLKEIYKNMQEPSKKGPCRHERGDYVSEGPCRHERGDSYQIQQNNKVHH